MDLPAPSPVRGAILVRSENSLQNQYEQSHQSANHGVVEFLRKLLPFATPLGAECRWSAFQDYSCEGDAQESTLDRQLDGHAGEHADGQGYSDLNFLIPEFAGDLHYKKGPYYADEGDFATRAPPASAWTPEED
jgi:hypothetical protein